MAGFKDEIKKLNNIAVQLKAGMTFAGKKVQDWRERQEPGLKVLKKLVDDAAKAKLSDKLTLEQAAEQDPGLKANVKAFQAFLTDLRKTDAELRTALHSVQDTLEDFNKRLEILLADKEKAKKYKKLLDELVTEKNTLLQLAGRCAVAQGEMTGFLNAAGV